LHLHCNQLGVPGNIETTLATIAALEGKRLHLAHVQFHAYGKEGPVGFSSAADRLVDALQANPLVTIDVGQVLFGQTVTLSGDLAHQAHHRNLAHPSKTILQRQELQGGCGILPFRYRHPSFVHGLQWTVGLELFLRMPDPSRVFLTTDHPNGAPFTTYPHLMRLLTDLDFREAAFRTLHPDVQRQSELMQLKRVFTDTDLAASTRWGPAMALGLSDRGSLRTGALADVAVYSIGSNAEETYREARWVFRRGQIVYDHGSILAPSNTTSPPTQPLVAPLDRVAPAIPPWETRWREIYHRTSASERISGDELQEMRSNRWEPAPSPPSSPKSPPVATSDPRACYRKDRKAN
jgi:formylmethanofuran dehydrogenase subunit A